MIGFEAVSVRYGPVQALADVSLAIEPGALCALVGPSGSGKSTLLKLVNRLVEPSAGTVRVRGQDAATLDPAGLRRSIGYVIQSVGLFPHRTVAQNVATVPRLLGWDAARIAARVEAMLALVRLDASLAARRPAGLSGGQAQRVGLARALAADPDILLMDEPFGAVDPITRRELRAELARIHAATGKTILFVTHDPAEALELATRILVLRGGRVVADGRPEALLDPGADDFLRALFGGHFGLSRLQRARVGDMLEPTPAPDAEAIVTTASLKDALDRMVELRTSCLAVRSAAGAPLGSIRLERIVAGHP